MAKSTRIRDVFVKFNRYFKDLYILSGTCFCGGDESEHDNDGFYYGVLNSKGAEAVQEEFGTHPLLYFDNIRTVKDDLSSYKVIENFSDIDSVQGVFENLYEKTREIDDWTPLPFSDGGFEKLLEGELVDFAYKPDCPPLTISKSLFPSMNRKTLEAIQYHVAKMDVDDLDIITFKVPLEYITLFMDYYFFL